MFCSTAGGTVGAEIGVAGACPALPELAAVGVQLEVPLHEGVHAPLPLWWHTVVAWQRAHVLFLILLRLTQLW